MGAWMLRYDPALGTLSPSEVILEPQSARSPDTSAGVLSDACGQVMGWTSVRGASTMSSYSIHTRSYSSEAAIWGPPRVIFSAPTGNSLQFRSIVSASGAASCGGGALLERLEDGTSCSSPTSCSEWSDRLAVFPLPGLTR